MVPATAMPARPASPRVLRAADALEATGLRGATPGGPVRVVVAAAALEAQGLGRFEPRRRFAAPATLEAYGLSGRAVRSLQPAGLPLR